MASEPTIYTVLIEGIKILGPAVVTGFVGYKVGKAQIDVRLKEVDKKHEFEAHKSLFELLVNRRQQLNENFKGLMEHCGFLLGATMGELDESYNHSMLGIANNFLVSARRAIYHTKEYFEKNRITEKDEYQKVITLTAQVEALKHATDFSTLRANILAVMPIYEELLICHDTIIDWELDEILKPYVKKQKGV